MGSSPLEFRKGTLLWWVPKQNLSKDKAEGAAMRWTELDREACSVARTVSVIGDRWTLLILRDCFLRVRRFEEFEQRLGITRHILADRLRKLVAAGVRARVAYQERPRRYEYRLTETGLDLHPVLLALVGWGDAHKAGES